MNNNKISYGATLQNIDEELVYNEQFLIKKEILTPKTISIGIENDFFERKIYVLNPLITNEIYNFFHFEIKEGIYAQNLIQNIKLKILNCIDINDKKSILKKGYKKYRNKLSKNSLAEDIFDRTNTINTESIEFIELVKRSISAEDETYMDYLINGESMNTSEHHIFNDWFDIYNHYKVLEFLKKELDNIVKNTTNQTNQKTTEVYYSKVFESKNAEQFFNDFLVEINALDQKGNPINRKFNPCCSAIFTISDFRESILKTNVDEKDFKEYLSGKYPTGFKDLNNLRFSDHSYQYSKIKDTFKEHLNFYKKAQTEQNKDV